MNSSNTFAQYFGCTLSSRQQMVVIDSGTNTVPGGPNINGAEMTLWEEWQPSNLNVGDGTTGDPTVDWWAMAFQESQPSGMRRVITIPTPTDARTYFSYTTLYLAEILGVSQDVAAVDRSTVTSPFVTLSQLQDLVPLTRTGEPEPEEDETGSGSDAAAAAMDNLGVLDVLWLAHRRPDLKRLVGHVRNPSGERLRAAGMVQVRIAGGTAWRRGSGDTWAEEKGAGWAGSEATL
ncbi:hypothetical protein J3R82DRAFT_6198 [Butyriboletus roseoflavus]|nr:hypothetical protein J3R82DRAFT_6198 [Butyriboletus roseoflavus]